METIIEACKALDYSWLPQTVDGFTLVTSTESDYTILANRISAGEDVLKVPIFHYQNELGWRWSALYDKEVEDYTVPALRNSTSVILHPEFAYIGRGGNTQRQTYR